MGKGNFFYKGIKNFFMWIKKGSGRKWGKEFMLFSIYLVIILRKISDNSYFWA